MIALIRTPLNKTALINAIDCIHNQEKMPGLFGRHD